MNTLFTRLAQLRLFQGNLDLHLVRASMVTIYFFFGYQKWFAYEAKGLIPFFTHGPLIFWMYPVFGMKGATYFLDVSEWLFGAWLFAAPDGWEASAGGFPAMVGNVAFLMKDVVLRAVSFYLLKQDVM